MKIYNDQFNDIRSLINTRLVELGTASIAVAAARDCQILWEQGFGWADREGRIPADEHTMYSLASISKPITVTGLMILKERGKLDLDQPINSYLGDAKLKAWMGNVDDATVRRIANHSSGLPLHYQFFYEDEPYQRPLMNETIRRYGNLATIPGEKCQYSNLGYGILDYVISRLSGRSYVDFMREEVFIPLGMTRASVNIGTGLEKYQAIRYGSDGLRIPFYDFDHPGGSAVFSSAHDLVRFGMFHLKAHLPDQKAILADETIDDMQRPTMDAGNGVSYGISWASREDNFGYHTVWHNGGMGGVSTTLMLIPSEKIAVVVLSNSASWDSASNQMLTDLVCKEILSVLLPKYAENRSAAEARQKQNAGKKQDNSASFSSVPQLIGEWNGSVHTYKGDIPVTFWFKESGDVHVKLGDQLKTLLNDISFKDNYLTGQMAGDIGTEDANRRPYHLHVSMKLRDDVLNGAMMAISLPGRRMGNALSHWIEIKKN